MRYPTLFLLLVSLVLPSFACSFEPAEGRDDGTFTAQQWRGQMTSRSLLVEAQDLLSNTSTQIAGSYLLGEAHQFEDIWQLWLTGTPPELDFERSLVLLHVVYGKNTIVLTFEQTSQRELEVRSRTTRRGGPGFSFVLTVLERGAWDSINGVPM